MDEEEYQKILKILYIIEKQEPGSPVNSDNLKLLLDMRYDELLSNLKYLKEEGYIELKEFMVTTLKQILLLKELKI